jgi:hypothetical protein
VSPTFRSRLSWVLAGAVLATLAGDSAVMANRQQRPSVPISVAVARGLRHESESAKAKREADRTKALTELFARRADAIGRRDRRAFLALVDPEAKEFATEQAEVFDNLGKLDFAHWSYVVTPQSYAVTTIDTARYTGADDVWLPVLHLGYQLKGFDKNPVGRRVVYTVVRRGKHWYVANDADLEATTSSGTSVRVDPWENGPIVVERGKHGIVIGHPADAPAVKTILREVESAIGHVGRYVGHSWGDRVVVVLPGDHDELNRVLENPEVPFDFSAIAQPLESLPLFDDIAHGDFAGSRVVINPQGFRPGDAFTRTLIRHEITHVATFERTGPLSPKWLVEGLAEYVGNAGSPFSTARLGSSLGALVDKSGVPDHLPLDSDFGLLRDAGVGYNAGWLLCRYVASRWGTKALLRFYDQMGTSTGTFEPATKLPKALRRVLHIDEKTLLRDWRPYVRAAVADLTKVFVSPAKPCVLDDTDELGPGDVAFVYGSTEKKVTAMGVERGAAGIWNVGNEDKPAKRVSTTILVGRDDAAAAAAERLVTSRYTPYDRTGRPVPNGRLYYVGESIGGTHYNETVAVLRVGIAVVEVSVAVPGFGDPGAETRALAARQYAALAA